MLLLRCCDIIFLLPAFMISKNMKIYHTCMFAALVYHCFHIVLLYRHAHIPQKSMLIFPQKHILDGNGRLEMQHRFQVTLNKDLYIQA